MANLLKFYAGMFLLIAFGWITLMDAWVELFGSFATDGARGFILGAALSFLFFSSLHIIVHLLPEPARARRRRQRSLEAA